MISQAHHSCQNCGTSLIERLLEKTMPDPETGCFNWTGRTISRRNVGKLLPYGSFAVYVNGRRKIVGAHRVSYAIFKGPIPEGLEVTHECDNARCINPEHLAVKTHAQNMADCAARGRASRVSRPKPSMRKLTPDQVAIVRSSRGKVSQRILAARFGVTNAAISNIYRGKTYTNVGKD